MTTISRLPAYNLKAVLNETGLKADVLRAWERRYELPQPQRTPGGHRLYSEYDIETVKWLQNRQAEGLSISRAVGLWKEMLESGRDPLAEVASPRVPEAARYLPGDDTRIESLRRDWVDACLAFDSFKADGALNQAFALYPVETVCTGILQLGISEIGNAWYAGKVSVQQEHFASAQASRRLETLLTATPQPTREQTILISCPSGEQHTLPVMLLSLFLSRRGLKVVYLGADIPSERLVEAARTIEPDLVVLAAQQLFTAASLQAAALVLRAGGFAVAYGGLIFNRLPALREHIPAHFLGEIMQEAIQRIEQFVLAPARLPATYVMDETQPALADQFRERRPHIEIALFEQLQKTGIKSAYLAEANFSFGNGLQAALQLGDPAFMEADLEWIKRLLSGRGIPVESLGIYLSVYSRGVRQEMGPAGAAITNWLEGSGPHKENIG